MSSSGALSGGLGAAGDLFGGIMGFMGDQSASNAYNQAAKYAQENAVVAARSGVIEGQQANRAIYSAVSGQAAVEGGGGLSGGGSNQYLQRASLQQGGLQKAIIANNAQMQVQGFQAEAAADTGQAQQASMQGASALGGGILGSIGSIIGI